MAKSPTRSTTRTRLGRVLVALAGAAALWFAVQGGEYGTLDLWRQRQRRVALQREIDSLARIVDSLRAYKRKVLSDPATQERIAREEFGMIRGKELLYRIAEPDTTRP